MGRKPSSSDSVSRRTTGNTLLVSCTHPSQTDSHDDSPHLKVRLRFALDDVVVDGAFLSVSALLRHASEISRKSDLEHGRTGRPRPARDRALHPAHLPPPPSCLLRSRRIPLRPPRTCADPARPAATAPLGRALLPAALSRGPGRRRRRQRRYPGVLRSPARGRLVCAPRGREHVGGYVFVGRRANQ